MSFDHERIQKGRHFIGYALGFEPIGLYDSVGAPPSTSLGVSVTNYIAGEYTKKFNYSTGSDLKSLLHGGISDVDAMLAPYIREFIENGSVDKAHELIENRETIKTIASIALLSETAMREMIKNAHSNEHSRFSHINEPSAALITTFKPELRTVETGCPVAHNTKQSTHEVSPYPIFEKFVRWSGRLSLSAAMNSRQ